MYIKLKPTCEEIVPLFFLQYLLNIFMYHEVLRYSVNVSLGPRLEVLRATSSVCLQFIYINILFAYDYLTKPSANNELETKRKEAALA